jgi:EAL domain-containing protein (putative c-di-GMP-specific phosphodiesterase class I)
VEEAILAHAEWRAMDPTRQLNIAINISARQLFGPELLETVKEALDSSGVPPQSVILEITETSMMSDVEEAILRLGQLRALGVRLALDDFGTGYSSISYVKRFPIDILKIDKSYVDEIGQEGTEPDLVRTLITLGHSLGLKIIAEGVESSEQADFLRALQCHEAQGFYFSKPIDGDSVAVILKERNSKAA